MYGKYNKKQGLKQPFSELLKYKHYGPEPELEAVEVALPETADLSGD